ncbi:hypothetical protein [Oceanobacillus salinisoli]|uniref:hypothetical protein n=1 Tax=Oceanobacillus salinisoli TaxID=2678611 RepID=UPI0012E1C940|nr:hypothetical protein [Oceanobacillus salinisoli]
MNIDLTALSEEMPDFHNHDEARQWFKEKFGDDFLIRSSDVVNETKIYYYHIVKDLELYQQYMESFAKPVKHEITNMETFESYSTVEISENGDVNMYI